MRVAQTNAFPGRTTADIDREVVACLNAYNNDATREAQSQQPHVRAATIGYTAGGTENAYHNATCISVNGVAIHGVPSDAVVLRTGDLVSVDIVLNGSHGGVIDVCRSFIVPKSTPAHPYAHSVDMSALEDDHSPDDQVGENPRRNLDAQVSAMGALTGQPQQLQQQRGQTQSGGNERTYPTAGNEHAAFRKRLATLVEPGYRKQVHMAIAEALVQLSHDATMAGVGAIEVNKSFSVIGTAVEQFVADAWEDLLEQHMMQHNVPKPIRDGLVVSAFVHPCIAGHGVGYLLHEPPAVHDGARDDVSSVDLDEGDESRESSVIQPAADSDGDATLVVPGSVFTVEPVIVTHVWSVRELKHALGDTEAVTYDGSDRHDSALDITGVNPSTSACTDEVRSSVSERQDGNDVEHDGDTFANGLQAADVVGEVMADGWGIHIPGALTAQTEQTVAVLRRGRVVVLTEHV